MEINDCIDDNGNISVLNLAMCIGVIAKDVYNELVNHKYAFRDGNNRNQWTATDSGIRQGIVINEQVLKLTPKGIKLVLEWESKGFFRKNERMLNYYIYSR